MLVLPTMGDDMHVEPGFHLSGTPGCPAARHLNGVEIGIIRNGAGARCRRLSPTVKTICHFRVLVIIKHTGLKSRQAPRGCE
jgi:hypothetical protein